VLPQTGTVLEIASGSGQHIVHFARALPQLTWQPSDPDEDARRSIAAWVAAEKLPNVRAPLALDVRAHPWPLPGCNAIVCINMVHIAPWPSTEALFAGARDIPECRVLYLYGPYRVSGEHTAPGNERFDRSLRAQNPAWGVRNLDEVVATARAAGFELTGTWSMPANNLSVVFARAAAGQPPNS